MRIRSLTILVFLGISSISFGQDVRLNLYSHYSFPDNFSSYYDAYNYYEGKIEGGYQYGIGIEYMTRPDLGIEISYQHLSTTMPTTYLSDYYFFTQQSDFETKLDYIMLGFMGHQRKMDSKLEGYAGLLAGMVIINAKDPDSGLSGSSTKFAWGLRLGGDIWLSEKLALNLQAQLLSMMQAMGGSVYFGTGGAGAGLSSYSTIFQFNLGGGLSYKLGKDN